MRCSDCMRLTPEDTRVVLCFFPPSFLPLAQTSDDFNAHALRVCMGCSALIGPHVLLVTFFMICPCALPSLVFRENPILVCHRSFDRKFGRSFIFTLAGVCCVIGFLLLFVWCFCLCIVLPIMDVRDFFSTTFFFISFMLDSARLFSSSLEASFFLVQAMRMLSLFFFDRCFPLVPVWLRVALTVIRPDFMLPFFYICHQLRLFFSPRLGVSRCCKIRACHSGTSV